MALLQQLDTIDNAACGWIQFMSKVRWGCRANPHTPCLVHAQAGSSDAPPPR